MTRRAWYADRPRCCEVCGAAGFVQAGHVIREQTVKREHGDRWDTRNRLWVGVACRCHERHTLAVERIPLEKLPDVAFDFAAELLGPGKAYNALRREYAGDDPRLDALLAAA